MAIVFRLSPEPTFRVLVDIPVPGRAPQQLEVEYRHKTREELRAIDESFVGRSEADCLLDIMCNWHNADGPFSKEALEKLLNDYPQAAGALLARYAKEVSGANGGPRVGN